MKKGRFDCIVIGVSAGATGALSILFSALPADFPIPILMVRHLHPNSGISTYQALQRSCKLRIREANDKEPIQPGIHIAPANYHLLVEKGYTFSLSIDERVQWARPSIDVLFESAAEVYGPRLAGIVLTGANHDGAAGLRSIQDFGGLVLVQDPKNAEYPEMPRAALDACSKAEALPLEQLGEIINEMANE